MRDKYVIQPVVRSLRVLELIAAARNGLTLKEVSAQAKLPKTTAFKHLYTLRDAGFVAMDDNRDRFRLGAKTLLLGGRENHFDQLRNVALPVMERLRDEFAETINLGVLEGSDIVYLAVLESRHALRTHSREGSRDVSFLTAIGRAILAAIPSEERLKFSGHSVFSEQHIDRPQLAAVEQEIAATHERGYALDKGEAEIDVTCVGAAILAKSGAPIAGLSISAPSARLGEDQRDRAAGALRNAVAEIGDLMADRVSA